MIPNIFVSSTIADLQYLREALRDAILDLRYHPVMSEYGEVGYIRPTTAADSCYRTVEQCQMVILILGKRYGSVERDGLSVTHKEYRAARDAEIPTITFVEPQVLHYKEVFDSSPTSDMWNDFTRMDNPKSTFALLDEIADSTTFNAVIPFASIGEAKEKLKLQLADFVGERLGDTIAPMSKEIKDILAEIKTLRNHLVHTGGGTEDTKKYLAATRYLLGDAAADYRKLLEQMFGDIDTAVEKVWALPDFPDVISAAEFTHEVLPDGSMSGGLSRRMQEPPKTPSAETEHGHEIYGHFGMGGGGYTVTNQNYLKISEGYFNQFAKHQKALFAKAKVT